jgi:anti-anti-sigma regulatory factor
MARHLSATFAAGGADRVVVVNLAGATFVDVAGLCFLFEAAGWAVEHGSRLYLAGCSAHLVRLLNLTDLLDGLDVIPAR